METTRHKVVVTTNFDNLVADSLSIFSKTYPLVCGHESLAGFISARARRPLVVKVHRDLLLAPKSAPEDLGALPETFSNALAEIFRHYTPIVIGYGGNDGSLMKFLKDLPKQSVPGGVYWCYWEGGELPSEDIRQFVTTQHGDLVPIPGFDETMMLLGNALEFDVPDKFVLDRAEDRAKRIVKQAQALEARLNRKRVQTIAGEATVGVRDANADVPYSTSEHDGTVSSEKSTEINALAKAVEKTMQRTSGGLRWWQWDKRAKAAADIAERDRIYQEAIAALPDSAELLTTYANFLKEHSKDQDKAETYYMQSIAVEPTNVIILNNYALFLTEIRRDHDKAETYYTQAIASDSSNAVMLSNYAYFVGVVRKDHDKAESYYKQAITADPNNASVLRIYADFLTSARKDHDKAETYYTQAIAADSSNTATLINYAYFLQDIRKDYDKAETYLTQAITADPTNSFLLNIYANFLTDVRKDHERAETYYTKSIAADPANSAIRSGYAHFLTEVRKDYVQAESLYKQALASDPPDANIFTKYARFLIRIGRTDEGLAMLEQAITLIETLDPDVMVRAWMYATCHWLPDRWSEGLTKLKQLLLVEKNTAWEGGLIGVVEAAKKRGHPAAEWLDPLAAVCTGTADASTLDGWDAWREA